MKPSTLIIAAFFVFFLAMGVPLAAVGFLVVAAVTMACMN